MKYAPESVTSEETKQRYRITQETATIAGKTVSFSVMHCLKCQFDIAVTPGEEEKCKAKMAKHNSKKKDAHPWAFTPAAVEEAE